MGFRRKWENFKHLDEGRYWDEICLMSEERLRLEHKTLQQTITSASAGAAASGIVGLFTIAPLALTAVNARRIDVNRRQCKLVQKRLDEKGWHGHEYRLKDLVIGAGPGVVAEMIIPAGGALASHAAHHVAVSASHHAATAATHHAAQHVSQAAAQHVAEKATEEVAKNLVTQHTTDAIGAVAHNASAFAHAGVGGIESEIFTASHGALGHLGSQYFSALPLDHAAAQAQILGAAAGQSLAVEAGREGIQKGTSYLTEKSLRATLDGDEKNAVFVTETEIGDLVDGEEYNQGIARAAKLLLDTHYESLGMYDGDGTIKDDISLIRACSDEDCDCDDYNSEYQNQASEYNVGPCMCGHLWTDHEDLDRIQPIVQNFCDTWYPMLNHKDHDGSVKLDLYQIEACKQCSCQDYDDDEAESRTCDCGHAWASHYEGHTSTEQKQEWIVGFVASLYLQAMSLVQEENESPPPYTE